ncbi:protein CROWDED NUCLEI 4-like [Senna tora]|uniref:Protein CROWDED NUCLEI 4-like n=1 Tax=Senna tora TaxID=362788 RepID=A0A835CHK0_9FABA|nr:protein CROWDED NUCLEI 4-like [Senna tora]
MAKGTEEEGEFVVTKYNPHFDELLETYNTLLEDSREVLEKYEELKVSHSKLLKAFNSMKLEKEALEDKIKSMSALIVENRNLKDTIDKLNHYLGQFVKREENLSLILGSQRNPNDKSGLGFEAESSRTKKNKEEAEPNSSSLPESPAESIKGENITKGKAPKNGNSSQLIPCNLSLAIQMKA